MCHSGNVTPPIFARRPKVPLGLLSSAQQEVVQGRATLLVREIGQFVRVPCDELNYLFAV
jgi:hypothetical protein